MRVFWLSYRIDEDTKRGRTYKARRDALLEKIKSLSVSDRNWEETTSFIVFKSNWTTKEIAGECRKAIDPQSDTVLIGCPHYKSAKVVGFIKDIKLLREFIDFCEIV